MFKRTIALKLFLTVLIVPPVAFSQSSNKTVATQSASSVVPDRNLLNINNISLWVQNDGLIGQDTLNGWGLIYPRGTAGLLFSDNLIWVGKVQDAVTPELRTGGGTYRSGTVPGVILEQGIPQEPTEARVFRYRKDYETADLRQDAAEYFHMDLASVSDEMIRALRSQYEEDALNWPWQLGAPYKDVNNNGVMDGDDYPDIEGSDQIIWFAYNDLDEIISKSFNTSISSGVETQVTLWAYRDVPELENVVFKRYRIIYKGTSATPENATIDSMYVAQWADADIGNGGDDLAGCDSVLSLGYTYNEGSEDRYRQYGWQTPGIGYVLLQGPLVAGNEADEGIKDFMFYQGARNLAMTSFTLEAPGDIIFITRPGIFSYAYWNALRGLFPDSNSETMRYWVDYDGKRTSFMAGGDPITGKGWVLGEDRDWGSTSDNITYYGWSSDYRMMLNSGPFTMALGDTQDVVFAIIAGMGADGRQSVGVVKHFAKRVRSLYPYLAERAAEIQPAPPEEIALPQQYALRQNYPNPFNPATNIEYSLPVDTEARLIVYNILGQQVRVLEDGLKSAGEYQVSWDGRDTRGIQLPSGVYIVRLEARHVELKRRMVLVR